MTYVSFSSRACSLGLFSLPLLNVRGPLPASRCPLTQGGYALRPVRALASGQTAYEFGLLAYLHHPIPRSALSCGAVVVRLFDYYSQ